jgi:hypothetical protein
MPDDYVQKLIELAGSIQPIEQPGAQDWAHVERELDLEFPSDFKASVSALGTGHFGVGLYLRNPCASSEYIRLSHGALVAYREMSAGAARDSHIALYPDLRGAVAIGGIDRQDFLLRPDAAGKSLKHLVWWDLDTEKVRELELSVSQFVHDLGQGIIQEDWAVELRNYFWRAGTAPFFTQWPGPSP